MSLPYFFLTNYLNGFFYSEQFLGIFIFTLAFFISDVIGIKSAEAKKNSSSANESSVVSQSFRKRLGISVFIVLLCVPIFHILSSNELPISLLLFSDPLGFDLSNARQNFTKGANYPVLFNLLLAWYIPLISSICLYFLWRLKFRKSVVFMFFLILIYSFFGLEKSPAVFLIFSILVASIISSKKSRGLQLFITVGIVCLLLCLTFFAQLYISDVNKDDAFLNSKSYTSLKSMGFVTPSDSYRLDIVPRTDVPDPILNLAYRIILTPIDVSFRFYEYYSDESHKERDLIKVLTYAESPKATNIVGNHAFTKRFPNKYTKYIDAYASIDADSYSLKQTLGNFFVAIFLVLVRIFFSRQRNNTSLGKYAYGINIAYLSYLPFQGGLQSILFSKGLLALMLFVWFFAKISNKNPNFNF